MKLVLIRHGQTNGNQKKRYIGRTDEVLSDLGREQIKEWSHKNIYPSIQNLYVSPMKRCIETAEIIYPDISYKICSDFRECDFGEFENKNYKELSDSINYQKWIDSNGTLPIPKGEDTEAFKKRCMLQYERIVDEIREQRVSSSIKESIALVVHGGTIMSILERYAVEKRGFYEWSIANGEGYLCEILEDGKQIKVLEKIIPPHF